MAKNNDAFNKYLRITKKYYYSDKTVNLIKVNRRIIVLLIFMLVGGGILSLIISAFYNNTKMLETIFLPITFSFWGGCIILSIASAKFYIFLIQRQLRNNELAFWTEALRVEWSAFVDLTSIKINHKYLEYSFSNNSQKYRIIYLKNKMCVYQEDKMLFNVNRQWFSKYVGFDYKRVLITRGDLYLNMMEQVALQTQKNINNSITAIIDNLKTYNLD